MAFNLGFNYYKKKYIILYIILKNLTLKPRVSRKNEIIKIEAEINKIE